MEQRRARRALAALLALALTLCAVPALAVSQAEIDALEARRDALQERQDDVREQLDSLRSDRDALLARKAALDEENELLRQDIVLLEEQIELYDGLIKEKQADVLLARAAADAQYERYRRRVRLMEEHSGWSYLSFLLKADSLADLLSRLNDISDILSNDKLLREEYLAARARAEEAAAAYEAAQEAQREKRTELLAREAQLEEQIESAGALVAQLEDDIEYYQEFYASVEAEKDAVRAEIDKKAAELKKQQEEEERRRRQASMATGIVSSGYYAWPSYTSYITSPFGTRTHPIYGVINSHSGVDIGAGYGTAITAAAAGTVSAAVVNYGTTGYGTYVAVYHPNGTTTLYAHMSSIAVSVGQTVTQGQTLGYVGSTGASTGPHLHFEIRVNGSAVDPMQYF